MAEQAKAKSKGKGKVKAKSEVAPYRPVRLPSVFDDMDRFFDNFFRRGFGSLGWPRMRWGDTWSDMKMPHVLEAGEPSVDIYEEGKNVVIKAELPGVKKEDLDVNVTDDVVTISGEKKREEKVEEKGFYRFERSYGSFSRSFPLPEGVKSAEAKAKFKDGVLQITIPKAVAAIKKEKKVSIE